MPEAVTDRPALSFVKLGGSLITDKTGRENVRDEVLARLADELASALDERAGRVVLGHGSGSFGHVAAVECGYSDHLGVNLPTAAVSAIQDAAARLHRRVVSALLAAGTSPFSIVPGSALVARGGEPGSAFLEPLERALEEGMVPVLYGDIVIDSSQRAVILSTESLFAVTVRYLRRQGWPVRRVVWLGRTEGILDAGGNLVAEVHPEQAEKVEAMAGGAEGTDVTGGMRHRLEAAIDLARAGVESVIADGRVPGLLQRALSGEPVPSTVVLPDRGVL